jgi:hypothetical protein
MIKSDLTKCLSGGFPTFMVGDLIVKHRDWNSTLSTDRGKLLRDNTTDSPPWSTVRTLQPGCPTHNATPAVLHIVAVNYFVPSVHLTVSFVLSPDHLPVLMKTICPSFFLNLLECPDITRINWVASKDCSKRDSRAIPLQTTMRQSTSA